MSITASCLCQKSQLQVETLAKEFHACDCNICRKWSGGPFMSMGCGTKVKLTKKDSIRIYDSSEWAERAFCGNCGTQLFYRLKQNQEYYIPVDLFDKPVSPSFTTQYFVDQKPSTYAFADSTHNMTSEQFYALFAKEE
ncbi:GFA family protein [Kangiella sp. TOML190]|uniref:GFA family protein n=1 Tax=Kangiella sp. TOML190 TaxID=2931351 RepID=UPI00203D32C7|nr:GFA family protein [Kangiella sp. TOML190]